MDRLSCLRCKCTNVCVWVCLINNAGHSFGVLEAVSNATWMFIFELLRFWFGFWLNALAVQFLLKFIWENENNNTIIISKRKQRTAGDSRKLWGGRGGRGGKTNQFELWYFAWFLIYLAWRANNTPRTPRTRLAHPFATTHSPLAVVVVVVVVV